MDLETQVLQILTNSELNSEDKTHIRLFSSQSNTALAGIQILFKSEMTYYIGSCTEGSDKFDKTPTITTPTTWKITKDKGTSILIWCNDKLVLTYKFESSPRSGCVGRYNQDVTKFRFSDEDSASNFYRIEIMEPGSLHCVSHKIEIGSSGP